MLVELKNYLWPFRHPETLTESGEQEAHRHIVGGDFEDKRGAFERHADNLIRARNREVVLPLLTVVAQRWAAIGLTAFAAYWVVRYFDIVWLQAFFGPVAIIGMAGAAIMRFGYRYLSKAK